MLLLENDLTDEIPTLAELMNDRAMFMEWTVWVEEALFEMVEDELDDNGPYEDDHKREQHKQEIVSGLAQQYMARRYEEIWNAIHDLGESPPLWRCMTLPTDVDPGELFHYGVFWANDERMAECHWGGSGEGEMKYTFKAIVKDVSAVSIAGTVSARMNASTGGQDDEAEITLDEGGRIWLESYEDNEGNITEVGKWVEA